MYIVIIILYALSLLYIFLFSLSQLHLTWIYLKHKKKTNLAKWSEDFIPHVTVQLPVYNEKYVVKRLLKAVGELDYPKEKLEIQVLDDSTDETTSIIKEEITSLQKRGLDITLVHRENRKGFKAGALAHATIKAKGDFIAIFDADFIPQQDFLRQTIPHFVNSKIGVVQTRWEHLNKNYSLLTQLQAFGLDAHFSIEQSARNRVGSFINFNGTCGVWRKQTIAEAGGWHDDTLTEDLDLSYRAQLKGWQFLYLEDVSTPGELPVVMPAIKSQQYRWNKGGAETARKIFFKVLQSKKSFITKLHAFFHLFNSSVFSTLLIAAVLSVPMLYIKDQHPELSWLFNTGIIFLLGFFSIAAFYWVSNKQFSKKHTTSFFKLFPPFLIISMGLSLHNGLAVIEGLVGRKTPFIRTPKFNITKKEDGWSNNTYLHSSLNFVTILEGILCFYFIYGCFVGIQLKDSGLLFFHIMLALGFGSIFIYSIKPLFTRKINVT
ncbi:glycosyl transferase family 2 [Chryseotalea sanaruensis]|uniref:Glycosyl transferase family 2 n=1 Tax=Chryseotalea sanaruensis TaxID=2482724 RepID=A0A401UB60_9BACT|nr:cellulose synthase family protein [Chryseotalea sanaruensis]GCC52143.1 glycosyl transferase family 2 [Chryseotalea sanaruensis]